MCATKLACIGFGENVVDFVGRVVQWNYGSGVFEENCKGSRGDFGETF